MELLLGEQSLLCEAINLCRQRTVLFRFSFVSLAEPAAAAVHALALNDRSVFPRRTRTTNNARGPPNEDERGKLGTPLRCRRAGQLIAVLALASSVETLGQFERYNPRRRIPRPGAASAGSARLQIPVGRSTGGDVKSQ